MPCNLFFMSVFSHMMAAEERKFVLFDSYTGRQRDLEYALSNFGRIRDNYEDGVRNRNLASQLPPALYVIGEIMASTVNATLITKDHPEYKMDKHPMILPILEVFDIGERTVEHYWSIFWSNRTTTGAQMPEFLRISTVSFNLAYCAIPKEERESIWNFSIFTKSFDIQTWLCLVISLILISILVNSSSSSPIFFSSLSALLSPGISAQRSRWKYSQLFVLRMMSSLVVVNFYSGEMTSKVISPPPEEKLAGVEDLESHNYSLIFLQTLSMNIVNATTLALSSKTFVHKDTITLARLMSKNVFPDLSSAFQNFFQIFTGVDNVATINLWPYAMLVANTANELITRLSAEGKENFPGEGKTCHVGERLISTGEMFFGYLPPGHRKLIRRSQILLGSGIISRWQKELFGMLHSRRVQDRIKVVSPTDMLDEVDTQERPLGLDGKIVTIFLLWAICLAISAACFLFEFLSSARQQN